MRTRFWRLRREGVTLTELLGYVVLFVIDVRARRVQIAGLAHPLSSVWMKRSARRLTDSGEGFLPCALHRIHDRDLRFAREFTAILKMQASRSSSFRPGARISTRTRNVAT
jgi:hypothetical protein